MEPNVAYIIPGYGESHRKRKGYDKIAKFLIKRGIKPVHVDINRHSQESDRFTYYVDQFLKKYKRPRNAEVYLLGFSFGAIIAFLAGSKVMPNKLILCSLSPYFKEDLPKLPKKGRAWWNKNFKNSQISFNKVASKIHAKTFLLIGDKEGPEVARRSKSAKRMIKNSALFINEGAKHNISQEEYLMGVKKVIDTL